MERFAPQLKVYPISFRNYRGSYGGDIIIEGIPGFREVEYVGEDAAHNPVHVLLAKETRTPGEFRELVQQGYIDPPYIKDGYGTYWRAKSWWNGLYGGDSGQVFVAELMTPMLGGGGGPNNTAVFRMSGGALYINDRFVAFEK